MDKITLSSGNQHDVDSFGISSSGHMFIRVRMSMAEAAVAFANGTDRIIYQPEDGDAIAINGFSQLDYIVNESDCVRVALVRPLDMEEVNNG